MGQLVRRLGMLGPGHDKYIMLPDPLKSRPPVVKGGEAPPVTTLPLPATFASLVVFGDSITAGQNATVEANRWANLVATAKGASLNNQGIAGTVLQNSNDSGGSPRVNNGRDRYVTALTGSNKREKVAIAYGFNDARYTGAPTTFNVEQYEVDYREILDGLISQGYGREDIIIVAPFYITDVGLTTGSAGFTGQTRAAFHEFVDVAAALAAEYKTYYADAYAAMLANGAGALIDTDNIHPVDAGHAVIANAVLAARRIPNAYEGVFLNDTFTDTDAVLITTHTAEAGGSWVAQSGYAPAQHSAIKTNRLYSPTNVGVYRNRATPPSADYYVEAVFDFVTTVAGENIGITGRASDAANTFYFARWSGAAGAWQLFKTVAGASTQLGSNYADTFTSGSKTVRLTMIGDTISLSVDGTVRVSVTDAAITAAGYAGVRCGSVQSATTGIHISSLIAA